MSKKGFTAIETIVYLSLVIALALAVLTSMLMLNTTLRRVRTLRAAAGDAAALSERLIRELRLADSIDVGASSFGTNPGAIQLNTIVSPSDITPTTRRFFLVGNTLHMQEGTSPSIALTGPNTSVTRFIINPHFTLSDAYYVRSAYSGCSDLAGGQTPATAWCTIDKAANTLVSGEIVYVGAGTYLETVAPFNSGAAGLPISYIADVGGVATGDAGAVLIDGENTRCYAFDLSIGKSYLVIDGFTAIRHLNCTSNDGAYYFIGAGNTNNIYRNLVAYDTRRDGIVLAGSDNTLENCLIYDTDDDGMEIKGDNNTIKSCTFAQNGGFTLETDVPTDNLYENNIFDGGIGWNMGDFSASTFNYNDWTAGVLAGIGNINIDPEFVSPASNDFHLDQIAAGQTSDSPALDIGSDTAAALNLDDRTTRTDNVGDGGQVDMGYHYYSGEGALFGGARSEWVNILIGIETEIGGVLREQTFHITGILRGSYD